VSDEMIIDPDAVEQASKDVIGVAEDLESRTTALMSATSNTLKEVDIREFDCRLALSDATVFWSRRATGCRERLEDAAEFMATNAAVARKHDADAAADFVELESEVYISIDDYSTEDYYEQTGAERPDDTGTDGAMPAGGERVAV
jgi:hypothetical protein